MSQQNLNFGTPAPNDGETVFSGFEKVQANFTELYARFGVAPDSVTVGSVSGSLVPDDSSADARAANNAAVAAASAYAIANGIKEIRVSPGKFAFNQGVAIGVGGAAQKSLHLKGSGGGAVEPQGTILWFPAGVTTVAVNVGTGQFMQASDFAILGELSYASRASLTGVGLGFNAGTHQIRGDNVRVLGFSTGYKTGYDGDGLCDSVTFNTCSADGYVGWHIAQSQNFAIALNQCISGSKIGVLADQGTPVNINGGNLSLAHGEAKAFTISGTSDISATTDDTMGTSLLNYTFTTTITGGDALLAAGDYDVFTILTPGFGLIPLEKTGYNSGTGVGTFRFYQPWLASHYDLFSDIKANTDLATEVAAATKLYAAEQMVTLRGASFNLTGHHLENDGSVTLFLDHSVGFSGARRSKIDGLHCNYDVAHGTFTDTDDRLVVFYCQQAFPFLRHLPSDGGGIEICNSQIFDASSNAVIFETCGESRMLQVRNSRLPRINTRVALKRGRYDATDAYTQGRGAGEWDQPPWLPSAESVEDDALASYLPHRRMAVPFTGFSPAVWARATLLRDHLEAIELGPGTLGDYPPLHGDTLYTVTDAGPVGGAATTVLIRSAHDAWSYGQDLTIDWSIKGHTHVATLSDTSRMFPGLVLRLDNGVDGDVDYIVTGVYPQLGYVTFLRLTADNAQYFAGTKTTTYTGATVKQQPFSFGRIATT